jgi:hypothetical protein
MTSTIDRSIQAAIDVTCLQQNAICGALYHASICIGTLCSARIITLCSNINAITAVNQSADITANELITQLRDGHARSSTGSSIIPKWRNRCTITEWASFRHFSIRQSGIWINKIIITLHARETLYPPYVRVHFALLLRETWVKQQSEFHLGNH